MAKKKQFLKLYPEIFNLGLNSSEFMVFTYLLSKSFFKNFRRQAVIAEDCNMPIRTLQRILKSLSRKGLLKVKSGQLQHKSNEYEIEKDYPSLVKKLEQAFIEEMFEKMDAGFESTPEELLSHEKRKREGKAWISAYRRPSELKKAV